MESHRLNAFDLADDTSTKIGIARSWNMENNEEAFGKAPADPTFTSLDTVSTIACTGGLATRRRTLERTRESAARLPAVLASEATEFEKPT